MQRRTFLHAAAGLSLSAMAHTPTLPGSKPLVIAHRGASGARPEHTLEAYTLAASQGADVIEPDLVFTKDGHLICRHDRYLSGSTNVSARPVFASRKTRKPGHKGADWFAEDFTLDEIKSLRARQPFPGRSTAFDDQYEIPTFADLVTLAKAERWRLCPEAKQPAVALANGHDFKAALDPFFGAVRTGALAPSFIQCFDPAWLQTIPKTDHLERVQLLYHNERAPQPYDLPRLAEHCEALGPNKGALVDAGRASPLLEDAKALGLKLYPWTFRADQLPSIHKTPADEYRLYFSLGVDGVFSDFPADALSARQAWLEGR